MANCRRCSTEAAASVNSGVSREVILTDGRGTPIIPVDEGNTSQGLTPNRRAVSRQTALQARVPSGPVAQFALPEFTITARTWPLLLVSEARPTSTGAAATRFFVNSAAPVVVRFSAGFEPGSDRRKFEPLGKKNRPGRAHTWSLTSQFAGSGRMANLGSSPFTIATSSQQ